MAEARKFGERISHQAVLHAVAKSLTAILSVQALSAFVRTRLQGTVWDYDQVYCERREGKIQPHDLIDVYLDPKSWKESRVHRVAPNWTELRSDAERENFDQFLRTGVEKYGAVRCPLKEVRACDIGDFSALNAFFQLEAPERISVVPNGSDDPRHADILPLLREMSGGIATKHDTFLLVRLPFGRGDASGEDREAILVALLWEPATAVRSMTFALLHTVWTGIRSCSELVRMADDAALASVARDVAHNVAAPISSFKSAFGTQVLSRLDGFPEANRTTLENMGVALAIVEHFAEAVSARASRLQRPESVDTAGECDLLALAKIMTENKVVVNLWKHSDVSVHQKWDPPTLSALVVQGQIYDWAVILYILLKNAADAIADLKTDDTAGIELILAKETTHGGVVQNAVITVCNKATALARKEKEEMSACLRGDKLAMDSKRKKNGNGVGLGLAGERLKRLSVRRGRSWSER